MSKSLFIRSIIDIVIALLLIFLPDLGQTYPELIATGWQAILSFFDDINKALTNSKRPLIIFPQGTRVKPEERPPFKKGVARIYEELKISCQPVAINSGYVWPKRGSKTPNKQITISILPSIDYQMEKNEFVNNLEKKIYSELNRIN